MRERGESKIKWMGERDKKKKRGRAHWMGEWGAKEKGGGRAGWMGNLVRERGRGRAAWMEEWGEGERRRQGWMDGGVG